MLFTYTPVQQLCSFCDISSRSSLFAKAPTYGFPGYRVLESFGISMTLVSFLFLKKNMKKLSDTIFQVKIKVKEILIFFKRKRTHNQMNIF